MPTYEYACTECGERLEVVQSFTDDSLTVCPACQGKLRKVFLPVGVVFKGSGFYKTDSRVKATSSAGSASSEAGKSPESNGDSRSTSSASDAGGSSDSSDSGGKDSSESKSKNGSDAGSKPGTGAGSKPSSRNSESNGSGSKVA